MVYAGMLAADYEDDNICQWYDTEECLSVVEAKAVVDYALAVRRLPNGRISDDCSRDCCDEVLRALVGACQQEVEAMFGR